MRTMMEYNISTDQPSFGIATLYSNMYSLGWAASGRDETSDKGLQWPVLCGCWFRLFECRSKEETGRYCVYSWIGVIVPSLCGWVVARAKEGLAVSWILNRYLRQIMKCKYNCKLCGISNWNGLGMHNRTGYRNIVGGIKHLRIHLRTIQLSTWVARKLKLFMQWHRAIQLCRIYSRII